MLYEIQDLDDKTTRQKDIRSCQYYGYWTYQGLYQTKDRDTNITRHNQSCLELKRMVRDTNFVYTREKKSGKDYAMSYVQRYRIKEWTLLRKRP